MVQQYINKVQRRCNTHLYNWLGWRSRRKIVVIESDDWGSIRMPSHDAYTRLLQRGIRVDRCHYCKYDALETEEDLRCLFDILLSVKDSIGRPAILTANAVVANPDFQRIEEAEFKQYYYKLIDEAFSENKGSERALTLMREGIEAGCFLPQSHGREHLNVAYWLDCLRNNFAETRYAFECGVYGISTTITAEHRKSFLPAFEICSEEDRNVKMHIAKEGLALFERIFGYSSRSFIAPNYTWFEALEETLKNTGVTTLQGLVSHQYATITNKPMVHLRKLGVNSHGVVDLARNVFFEPSATKEHVVDNALREMAVAFKYGKPAIICSHRVNFMGGLDVRNRDNNLSLLAELLHRMIKLWPDIEFMSSPELGDLIQSNN